MFFFFQSLGLGQSLKQHVCFEELMTLNNSIDDCNVCIILIKNYLFIV